MITSTDRLLLWEMLFYVWSSTRPASLIALSHSSFEPPWLTMGLVVLLTIHRHFYVVLQPCGIRYQHHTWRVVEVIETSISASPEECMHASVGEIFNLLALSPFAWLSIKATLMAGPFPSNCQAIPLPTQPWALTMQSFPSISVLYEALLTQYII